MLSTKPQQSPKRRHERVEMATEFCNCESSAGVQSEDLV